LHFYPFSSLSAALHHRVIPPFTLNRSQLTSSPSRPLLFLISQSEQAAGRRFRAARMTSPRSSSPTAPTRLQPSATTAVHCPPAARCSVTQHVAQHSPHLQPGASLRLNLCSDVPDSEIPEICRSLIKTVGYKMYFIGERQVTPTSCAFCAPPSPPSPALTLVQVCSDLGFQQFGHWSLIDNGNPDVGVRCSRCPPLSAAPPTHFRRVEYGFGPQYSSAVRQSVSGCELVARAAGPMEV
jgi:hypothetical protein